MIHIKDDIYINSDSTYSFTIGKLKKAKQDDGSYKEEYSPEYYFSNLSGVINQLGKMIVSKHIILGDLSKCVQEIEDMKTIILAKIKLNE